MIRAAAAVVAALMLAAPAAAQRMSYGKAPLPGDSGPPAPEDVRFEQKLGDPVPLDLEFTDHDGHPVRLRDLTGGKPTLLVLAYYRCPKLCNQVLTGLLDSLKAAAKRDPRFIAGGPFNVITVSIDPREDYHLAAAKRTEFMKEYGRSPDVPGWWFLTASRGQGTDVAAADRKVHELAAAVGYKYTLRARGRDFLYRTETGWVAKDDGAPLTRLPKDYDYQHASGVIVLAPDGRVTQYLPGINYDAGELRSAIGTAAAGTVGRPVAQELLDKLPKCFVYDQVSGHYRPTMFFTALVSLPVLGAVLFVVYRTVRRGLREKPLVPGEAPPTAH